MPAPLFRALPVVALAALAFSCSAPPTTTTTSTGPRAAGGTSAAAGDASPATSPQPGPQTGVATDPAARELTLAFAGDVHFESYVRRLLDEPDQSLQELRPTLGAADLALVNLETALTERGTKVAKSYNFRAPATALDALAAAGVDGVSLANNHGVDYGAVGLADTLTAKRSGVLPMVGIGADAAEAFAPKVFDVKGVTVAVLASLQLAEQTSAQWSATDSRGGVAANLDMTRLRQATRAAAAAYDVVVVFMHWGTEYATCADAAQKRTAAALEQDGADLVVGGHAHRPQGAGWLGRAFVAYGLGNFVWWRSSEPDSRSGVLTVTVDAAAARGRGEAAGPARRSARPLVTAATWTPMLIGADGVPREPREAATSARLHDIWQRSSACSGLRGSA